MLILNMSVCNIAEGKWGSLSLQGSWQSTETNHLMHWVRQGSRLVETQIYIGDEWIINQMDREIAAGLVYLNCFDGMNQLHELVAKCEFP